LIRHNHCPLHHLLLFRAFKKRNTGLVFGDHGVDLLHRRFRCRGKARVSGFDVAERGLDGVVGLLDELGFAEASASALLDVFEGAIE
jgi:hypothetical protein